MLHDILIKFARKVFEELELPLLTLSSYPNQNFDDSLKFLKQVLKLTERTSDNPTSVYSMLQLNLEKLDYNLIHAIKIWTNDTLVNLDLERKQQYAITIGNFSRLIQDFSSGRKTINLEIAIAGYEAILILLTPDTSAEIWVIAQYNLGNVYLERIQGERTENVEQAIAAYEAALSVYTRNSFPQDWAMTQNNLGNAYLKRIKGERTGNIEQAIAAYKAALSVYTRNAFPQNWAMTQNNLGNAYRERIKGDRAENIEQAIAAYQAALLVYTRNAFPQQWATILNNLGTAYSQRIKGDKAENIEQAIAAYQAALLVRTPDVLPQDWATTQNNLGNAYSQRIQGDRAENIEQAIAAYQAALSIYTHEVYPQDWAMSQNNLGVAYRERIKGDKAENIEQAISAYQAALSVRTREACPQDWATTQNNLGNAYSERVKGDKAENIEQAIEVYNAALSVRTCEAFPQDWATTQNNLGLAYSERIKGDKAENIEQALAAYQAALSIYTLEAFPQNWASIQNNLGNAYRERIKGDKAKNIEQALAAYNETLLVRTRQALPRDWANTQNNLGNVYNNRISGNKQENIEQAIAAYQLALSVYTPEAFSQDWAMTQSNLGVAYNNRISGNKQENIEQAIAAYQLALSVYTPEAFPQDWANIQNSLGNVYSKRIEVENGKSTEQAIAAYQAALSVYTREAFPRDNASTLYNLGLLYLNTKQWQAAYNTFADAIDSVELLRGEIRYENEIKEKTAVEWHKLYQAIVQVCLELGYADKAIEYVERSKTRNLVELLATREIYPKGEIPEEARNELQQLRRNIYVENRYIEAEPQRDRGYINRLRHQYNSLFPFEPIQFDQIQNLIDNHTAIIQWYISENCFRCFIITRHNPQPVIWQSSPEDLQELHDWCSKYVEAYYAPKEGDPESEEVKKLQKDWEIGIGCRLQQLSRILHINEIINTLYSISNTFDKIILVPHLYLHLFPLHALPVSSKNQFLKEAKSLRISTNFHLQDCFIKGRGVSYAPSCQLLKQLQKQQCLEFKRLFAIRNPTPDLYQEGQKDLGFVSVIEKQFKQFKDSDTYILKERQAIKSEILRFDEHTKTVIQNEKLLEANCVLFFCHGEFNVFEALDSGLKLADGNLTLQDIIAHLNLKNCRLVTLSACETGLTKFPLSDEYTSLPYGFLLAGSTNVVSSLWSVSAIATALLMIKFYDELQRQNIIPLALNTAQCWLRDTTVQEFQDWLERSQLDKIWQRELRKYFNKIKEERGSTAKPFELPYYWAAFCAVGKGE